MVRWRHEKGRDLAGPGGGDGGRGGDVYVKAVRDLGVLSRYRHVTEMAAGDGKDGMRDSMHGGSGKDVVVELPLGSVIESKEMGRKVELLSEGETVLVLHGGRGGFGNQHFKSSKNTTPREFTKGAEGESGYFNIELRLIADLGLIGLPNAGKSSLLNSLTRAKAKVASYQFTTLEPNLGEMYGFILADIPGLIEGAASGRGLGHKFLRHIERTKLLLHCISLEDNITESYEIVRKELKAYNKALLERAEIIVLTKSDSVDERTLNRKLREAKELERAVLTVSVLDDKSLKDFKEKLAGHLQALTGRDRIQI